MYKVKIYLTTTPGYEFGAEMKATISGKPASAVVQDNQIIISAKFKYVDGAFVRDEDVEIKVQKTSDKPWSKASNWAEEELTKASDNDLIPWIFTRMFHMKM